MGRVLLISANREHFPEAVFPLGVAYVASSLAREDMEVRIFDAGISRFHVQSLRKALRAFVPDLVGLSLRNIDNAAYPCTRYYGDGYVALMNTVRSVSSAPVVLGGPAFSIFSNDLMKMLGADRGVIGDGEDALLSLCKGGQGAVLPSRPSDLSEVEFPRNIQSVFPAFRHYRTIGVQTRRGCPHRCVYCTYPDLEGGKIRVRPAEAVAGEIAFLLREHDKGDFFIVDSTFNADEAHMERVCRAILAKRLRVRFSCYLTPAMSNLSLFRLLSEAGCVAVDFGADSGSDEMLGSLGKGFTVRDIHRVSAACREAGIDFCHSLIFGGPGERKETVEETVRLMDLLKPTAVVAMTGIRIYPGTEMQRLALREGVISAGEGLLRPRFYFHGEDQGLLRMITGVAAARTNWFLPGRRDWSSALGPRLLRLVHRSGPLWRTFRQP
ncbi:MAG: radical SAM protein [Nitrospirae bacterium]|nr:radical SAM protein [Nitrospirota bacterium]